MNKTVLVAMSGGVDSSVAAYLLKENGCEVTGATMRLYDSEITDACGNKICGSLAAIEDARKVADSLGIGFEVCDFRHEFRDEVIGRFIDAYERGMTPNPCVECNRYFKFDKLFDFASEHGLHYVATGHYAVIEYNSELDRYLLKKSPNQAKDQSYVLYSLTQDKLARTLFPLGAMTKDDTRQLADKIGLQVAQKKESQDICFVPDGDYVSFIEECTGREYTPGDFVDFDGNVLGTHQGIIRYTIGQRKGLGLALKKPMYVNQLDMENNRVILGDNDDLFKSELTARDVNWISMDNPTEEFRASARIRYKHHESPATIIPLEGNRMKVVFDEPQRAITRGQSVVIYDGDYVVGGGKIE